MLIECENHLATSYVIPDMIILSSYLFGLYTFRYVYPEHLVTLIEKVLRDAANRMQYNVLVPQEHDYYG